MIIKEYENNKFQIWTKDERRVLHPRELQWEGYYQWKHDFMFIDSLKEAKSIIKQMKQKELGLKVIKIHKC